MSQTFTLCIATETLAQDAKQLGVTVDDLKHICVQVSTKIVQQPVLHLQLSYHIDLPTSSLAAQFNWPTWRAANVGFSDYLWEETCLECFVTGNSIKDEASHANTTDSYIEINASPDGRYALYQFESYRNPATLPPTPLYHTDGSTRACIDWTDNFAQKLAVDAPLLSKSTTASKLPCYERCFGVPLTQLSNQQYALSNTRLEYIHPCVILKFGETILYFAPNHASPPDFHNRDYWSRFEY